MDSPLEVTTILRRIHAHRRVIIGVVLASTLTVAVIALLLPPWFRAETSLLPPNEEDNGFGIASLLKGFGVPGV